MQVPDKFYFYTPLTDDFSLRKVESLLEGRLFLTRPDRFNDPFDAKLRLRGNLNAKDAERTLLNGGFLDEDIQSFSASYIQSLARDLKEQHHYTNYRVFCMSEACDLLLMWAYYANKHSGICIELKVDKGCEHLVECVRYTTHYPNISVQKMSDRDLEQGREFVLTKSTEWLHEKEWRIVVDRGQCREFEGVDGVIDSPFRVSKVFHCHPIAFKQKGWLVSSKSSTRRG